MVRMVAIFCILFGVVSLSPQALASGGQQPVPCPVSITVITLGQIGYVRYNAVSGDVLYTPFAQPYILNTQSRDGRLIIIMY